jgi:hypothetical protein
MAINFVDIELHEDTPLSEYTSLNLYLLSGWTIIGQSTYTTQRRYGEMNEFVGEPKSWERYTLFKPDHTIGESLTPDGSRALGMQDDTEAGSNPEKVYGYGVWKPLPCTFCNTLTVSRETLICSECGADYGDEDPEPATPPTTATGTPQGYTVRQHGSGLAVVNQVDKPLVFLAAARVIEAEKIADALHAETENLRAELAAERERVAELERELIASREKYLDSINKRHAELADYQANYKPLIADVQKAYDALTSNGTDADKVHNAIAWLRGYVD